jgi:hypothetical protein
MYLRSVMNCPQKLRPPKGSGATVLRQGTELPRYLRKNIPHKLIRMKLLTANMVRRWKTLL